MKAVPDNHAGEEKEDVEIDAISLMSTQSFSQCHWKLRLPPTANQQMQNLITLFADPADNLTSTLTLPHSLEYQWDFFSPLLNIMIVFIRKTLCF